MGNSPAPTRQWFSAHSLKNYATPSVLVIFSSLENRQKQTQLKCIALVQDIHPYRGGQAAPPLLNSNIIERMPRSSKYFQSARQALVVELSIT